MNVTQLFELVGADAQELLLPLNVRGIGLVGVTLSLSKRARERGLRQAQTDKNVSP
jgi:hypothetical protein